MTYKLHGRRLKNNDTVRKKAKLSNETWSNFGQELITPENCVNLELCLFFTKPFYIFTFMRNPNEKLAYVKVSLSSHDFLTLNFNGELFSLLFLLHIYSI